MAIIYLSLGSNVGDRKNSLRNAIQLLSEKVKVLKVSSVYRTKPLYETQQPWFYNMVVKAETSLSPSKLQMVCQKIEGMGGKNVKYRYGPRSIDIDVLLYDDKVVKSKKLVIPHPKLQERRFVLQPLVEISPKLCHPVSGTKMKDLLKKVSKQPLTKLQAKGI